MAWVSVSAESKGLICTKIVQFSGVPGTAHSKGLSRCDKKRASKSMITKVKRAQNKNASDGSEAKLLTVKNLPHSRKMSREKSIKINRKSTGKLARSEALWLRLIGGIDGIVFRAHRLRIDRDHS